MITELIHIIYKILTVTGTPEGKLFRKLAFTSCSSLIIGHAVLFAQTGPGGVGNSTSNRLWLKADGGVYRDAGSTIASDGEEIMQWNDFSGNDNNAVSSVGSGPSFRSGIVNNSGTFPAIQVFGGRFLDAGALGIPGSGSFSVVVVLKVNTGYLAGTVADANGDYIIDRYPETTALAGLKIVNTDKYGFQKRDNYGGGLDGPVSTSSVNTSNFTVIDYMRDRGLAYNLFLDGLQEGSVGDGDLDLTLPDPRIGRHFSKSGLKGYITEVLMYNYALNSAQLKIINSYLGAKYDLNLDPSANKYAFRSTHKYDVAGIGRDDNLNFHDNATSAGILNISNPSGMADGNYLLFGHDNGSIASWTSTESPGAGLSRIAREWKLNKTGGIETVTATIDVSSLPAPPGAGGAIYILMVDADGDFSSGATLYDLTPLSGNLYSATGIPVSDGYSVSVGVRMAPTVSITPDPAQMCVGGTLNMNANPSGGTGIYVSQIWTGNTVPLSSTTIPDPTFSTNIAGTYDLTFSVTDNMGLTGSENITVTVADNPAITTDPVGAIICSGNTYTMNVVASGGTPSLLYQWLESDDNGVTDPWANVTGGSGSSTSIYTTPPLTTNKFYRVLVSATGNACTTATSGSAEVQIGDIEKPVIIGCPPNIIQSNDAGLCTAVITWTEPSATDNCTDAGSLIWNKSYLPGSAFPVGTTTVTYTAMDLAGNISDACIFTVTVNDSEKPVISGCPSNIGQDNDPGQCSAVVTWSGPSATDNCTASGDLVWTGNHAPGSTFPVGTTTVILSVTDLSGNTNSCQFDVVITDSELPTITCAVPAASYPTDAENCFFTVPGTDLDPTASGDNCGVSLVFNNITSTNTLSGVAFPAGTTTVIWTVTDIYGNSNNCQYDVVVTDNELPLITCAVPAAFYPTDAGNCFYTVPGAGLDPVAIGDNCEVSSVINNISGSNTLSGVQFPVGTTTVIWTITDTHGNRNTCQNDVVVKDVESPSITCAIPATSYTADAGFCYYTVPGAALDPQLTGDNCDVSSVINNITGTSTLAGAQVLVGITTIIWTISDTHGNTNRCQYDLVVTNNELPTITCAVPQAFYTTDAGHCYYTVPGAALDPTATADNCGVATVTNNITGTSTLSGAQLMTGTTTVIWTVTDILGIKSSCRYDVLVTDNESPVISCAVPSSSYPVPAGYCYYTVPDTGLDPTATADNCGVFSVTNSITGTSTLSGAQFTAGTTTVIWTITDINGNSDNCGYDIIVTDSESPSITCAVPAVSYPTDAGFCYFTVPGTGLDPTATGDNCGVSSIVNNINGTNTLTGVKFNTGTTTVIWTITDIHGNTKSCQYDVNVTDNESPAITCPIPAAFYPAGAGVCYFTVPGSGLDPTSTGDNCGVSSVTNNITGTSTLSGVQFEIGSTTVVWTITDIHGKTNNCQYDIVVADNQIPVSICKNISITLDAVTGKKSITPEDINNGSFDNCGIESISASKTDFDCSNIGSNNVILTVTDIHGNISTCNSTVNVNYALIPDLAVTPVSEVICNGGTTNINFSNNIPATSWTWTIAAPPQVTGGSDDLSGTGTFIQQTLNNSDVIVHKVVYTIVPRIYGSCDLTPVPAEVYVEPTPQATIVTTTPVVCNGSTADVTINSPTVTTTPSDLLYVVTVTSTDPGHLGGTALAGFTKVKAELPYTISGTLTNSSDVPIIVTYTILPQLNGCSDGPEQSVTVTVVPTPQTTIETTTPLICSGSNIDVTINSPTVTSTTSDLNYIVSVTSTDPSHLSGSASGDLNLVKSQLPYVLKGTLINSSDVPIVVTYTVTPALGGCTSGPEQSVTVTVEPAPRATIVTSTPVVCNGNITDITINSPTVTTTPSDLGYVVTVTSTNPGHLGGTASTGFSKVKAELPFIISGTLTNSSDVPIIVTYTITPKLNGCSDGPPQSLTVTVEPAPQATIVTTTPVICNGSNISVMINSPTVTTTPSNLNYIVTVTSTDPSHLSGSASGNINLGKAQLPYLLNGTLINSSDVLIVVTYTVTPALGGCAGGPEQSVTVTVEPSPQATIATTTPVVCNGSTADITINSPTVTTIPSDLLYVVTVTSTDPGHLGGTASTGFTKVKTELPFTLSGTLTNSSDSPIIVTYKITPELNGCSDGSVQSVTVTVEPTPKATIVTTSPDVCNGSNIDVTINSPTVTTTLSNLNYIVNVTSSDPSHLSGSASGNFNLGKAQLPYLLNGTLINSSDVPVVVTYTVTPALGGCTSGPSQSVTVTVEPTAQATIVTTTPVVCNGSNIDVTINSPTVTTTPSNLNYIVNVTSTDPTHLSGSASGNFNVGKAQLPYVLNGILINSSDVPVVVTYTVTPALGGCTNGSEKSVTVTVEPTPQATIVTSTPVLCNGSTVDITINSPTVTTTQSDLVYVVTVTSTDPGHLGGTASTGFTKVKTELPFNISGTLTNSSDSPIIVTYTVTPELNGCSDGPGQSTTVTVVPTPQTTIGTTTPLICSGSNIDVTINSPTVTSTTSNLNYIVSVTSTDPSHLSGSASGDLNLVKSQLPYVLNGTLINSSDVPIVVTYTVTPALGGCTSGPEQSVTVTVEPTPRAMIVTSTPVVCNGNTTDITINSPTVTTTPSDLGYIVSVTSTDPGHLGGTASTGFTKVKTELPFTISGTLTNSSDSPIIVTYTVTPKLNGCSDGPAQSVTVTVEPTPQATIVTTTPVICNGSNIGVTINSPTVTTTPSNLNYIVTVTSTDPSHLSGSASGNINLGKAQLPYLLNGILINSSDVPIVATYTVTPALGGCAGGPEQSVTVTVEPTPQATIVTTTPVVCNGSTADITINSPTSTTTPSDLGYVVTVTSTDPGHLGGTASTGFTKAKTELPFTLSGTLTNSSDSPIIVTYTITPELNGCSDGSVQSVTVTVEPTPQATIVTTTPFVCNGSNIDVTINSPTVTTTLTDLGYVVTVSSTDPGHLGGTASTGFSKVKTELPFTISGTLTNSSDSPIIVTYTITPKLNGCSDGPAQSATVTVEPTPQATIATTTPVVCNGSNIDVTVNSPTITTTPSDLNYIVNVTSTDPSHLSGSASGNISLVKSQLPYVLNGILINSSDVPIVVTYTITPALSGCASGPAQSVTVTVEPTPQATIVTTTNLICNGSAVDITINSPTVTTTPSNLLYVITVTSTDPGHLGGTASTGFTKLKTELPFTISGTLTNSSDAPIIVTYTVTPGLNGCSDGPAQSVTVTVEPTPQTTIVTTTPVVCNGSNIDVTINSPTVTTTSSDLNYSVNVTSTDPLHLSGSASGNINLGKAQLPYVLNGTLINSSDVPIVVTYKVTPALGGCTSGPAQSVSVTVEPTPQATIVTTTNLICNGSTVEITINSPTVTTIPSDLLYVVTVSSTDPGHLGGTASTGFTKVRTELPFIISGTLTNSSDAPIIVTYTITPKLNGCSDGPAQSVTVTVEPTPQATIVTTTPVVCNGSNIDVTINSPTVTTTPSNLNYTVNVTSTDPSHLSGSASGNINLGKAQLPYVLNGTLINSSDVPIVVTYTVTPALGGCASGPVQSVTVTVEPTPQATMVTSTPEVCNGSTVDITINSPTVSTTPSNLAYVVTITSTDPGHLGGTASTGFTKVKTELPFTITGTLTNSSDAPIIVTYTITPELNGCSDGPSQSITVTVEPTPQVIPGTLSQTICNDGTTSITLGSPSTFSNGSITFNYTVVAGGGVTGFNTPVTGLVRNDIIADVLHNPSDAPQAVTYTIVPISPGGCSAGPEKIVVITVNPTPRIFPVPASIIQCDNTSTNIQLQSPSTFTDGSVTFRYSVTATGGVTGFTTPVSGLSNFHIIADNLNNPIDVPQTVTYSLIPVSPTGCSDGPGTDVIVSVNPTPRIYPVPLNTTQCDSTTTNIQLQSPTQFTSGLVTFSYNVNTTGPVTGFTTPTNGFSNNETIADNLINHSDTYHIVTYRIVPVSPTGCSDGPGSDISVTVNPTPRVIPVNPGNLKPDSSICNGGITQIILNSPTVMTSGAVTLDYTVAVTGAGVVVGNTSPEINRIPGYTISRTYLNNSDSIQSVYYSIIPKVNNSICVPGKKVISEIRVHAIPLQTIVVSKPLTCSGGAGLASLRAIISRGANPYQIVWDGPLGYHKTDSTDIANLSSGKYVVKVTDNLGCFRRDSINIVPVSARANITAGIIPPGSYNISCIGSTDGTIRVYVSGGITPPYTYRVLLNDVNILYSGIFTNNYNSTDPTTFKDYTGLGAGSYTLVVRDVNGCENSMKLIFKVPPPIVVGLDNSKYAGGFNVSCKGSNDGSAWVKTISGGRGGYIFRWYTLNGNIPGPINTERIDNLTVGMYFLETRDVKGCIKTDSITINEPDGIKLSDYKLSESPDSVYNISCNGGSDGTIELTLTGGSGNYIYSWTGPDGFLAITKDISGLKAGVYTCSVRDLNDCILTPSPVFTLTEPSPILITSSTSKSTDGAYNINCFGGTGSVSITVTGGSGGNYIYTWSTVNGSGIIAGQKDQSMLTAGTYHLVVKDFNNCEVQADITLTQPSLLAVNLHPKHITCQSLSFNNGSIDLTVSTGVPPYTYLWSNGEVTEDIAGLTQGNYSVKVTDSNGCTVTGSAVVNLPPPLTYTKAVPDFNGYNISCNGLTNGSIAITMTSGTAPYIYTWNGPAGFTAATKDISGLIAGRYNLSIIDSNFCTATENIDLTEPGKLGMSVILSESTAGGYNINCAGDYTGSIDIEPVNQVKTVNYLWSDGIFGNKRVNLPAGIYNVIISDANNCHASSSIALTQPDSLRLSFQLTGPFCPDKPDGEIRSVVTGGVTGADYSYRWSDNSVERNISNIPGGSYQLTVSDINGCTINGSVDLLALNETCLVIPNAFSPNGDLINDVWVIGMTDLYPQMEIKIFNRWGELLWRSEKGYPHPWDGRSNGSLLPIDSYHYIIDLHNGSKLMIGNVTIVR